MGLSINQINRKSNLLPSLVIKDIRIEPPIIQIGMGVGVWLYPLASAVAREGGVGVISSDALDRLLSKRYNKKFNTYEPAYARMQPFLNIPWLEVILGCGRKGQKGGYNDSRHTWLTLRASLLCPETLTYV